jgi:hypothetical protein
MPYGMPCMAVGVPLPHRRCARVRGTALQGALQVLQRLQANIVRIKHQSMLHNTPPSGAAMPGTCHCLVDCTLPASSSADVAAIQRRKPHQISSTHKDGCSHGASAAAHRCTHAASCSHAHMQPPGSEPGLNRARLTGIIRRTAALVQQPATHPLSPSWQHRPWQQKHRATSPAHRITGMRRLLQKTEQPAGLAQPPRTAESCLTTASSTLKGALPCIWALCGHMHMPPTSCMGNSLPSTNTSKPAANGWHCCTTKLTLL